MPSQGDWALVQYAMGRPAIHHSCLLVAQRPGSLPHTWYIATPDGDVYEEDLIVSAAIRRVDFLPCHRSYPADIIWGFGASVHEFALFPNLDERTGFTVQAFEDMGILPDGDQLLWQPRIVAEPPRASEFPTILAEAAAAFGPPVVGSGRLAALVVALGGPDVPAAGNASTALGAPVGLPEAARPMGGGPLAPELAQAVSPPGNDNRLLPIDHDAPGALFRTFRDGTSLLSEHILPDWPITGPRTTLWLCRFFVQNSGTPLAWFSKFRADGKLSYLDEGIEEIERSCRQIQTQVCYDQLNISDLASCEILSRSIQFTAYRYLERVTSGREDSFGRGLMHGTQFGEVNLPVCPLLHDYMSTELQKKNAIDTERRQAQEARINSPMPRGRSRSGRRRGGKGEPEAPAQR